ncbi:uncharacterized protein [Primulina huaijiensis]|uniref:uncharacterized protein n=1 Tax=Primulina eburnea TaxID=1245227 RepID=UPI003C6C713E
MAGNDQDWRKNADTHKMSTEEMKKTGVDASKRPPGHNPGGVLHQRRGLPYSPYVMAAGGVAVVGTIWYFTIYLHKKPEASARDVAKVSAGVAEPEQTRPRK